MIFVNRKRTADCDLNRNHGKRPRRDVQKPKYRTDLPRHQLERVRQREHEDRNRQEVIKPLPIELVSDHLCNPYVVLDDRDCGERCSDDETGSEHGDQPGIARRLRFIRPGHRKPLIAWNLPDNIPLYKLNAPIPVGRTSADELFEERSKVKQTVETDTEGDDESCASSEASYDGFQTIDAIRKALAVPNKAQLMQRFGISEPSRQTANELGCDTNPIPLCDSDDEETFSQADLVARCCTPPIRDLQSEMEESLTRKCQAAHVIQQLLASKNKAWLKQKAHVIEISDSYSESDVNESDTPLISTGKKDMDKVEAQQRLIGADATLSEHFSLDSTATILSDTINPAHCSAEEDQASLNGHELQRAFDAIEGVEASLSNVIRTCEHRAFCMTDWLEALREDCYSQATSPRQISDKASDLDDSRSSDVESGSDGDATFEDVRMICCIGHKKAYAPNDKVHREVTQAAKKEPQALTDAASDKFHNVFRLVDNSLEARKGSVDVPIIVSDDSKTAGQAESLLSTQGMHRIGKEYVEAEVVPTNAACNAPTAQNELRHGTRSDSISNEMKCSDSNIVPDVSTHSSDHDKSIAKLTYSAPEASVICEESAGCVSQRDDFAGTSVILDALDVLQPKTQVSVDMKKFVPPPWTEAVIEKPSDIGSQQLFTIIQKCEENEARERAIEREQLAAAQANYLRHKVACFGGSYSQIPIKQHEVSNTGSSKEVDADSDADRYRPRSFAQFGFSRFPRSSQP